MVVSFVPFLNIPNSACLASLCCSLTRLRGGGVVKQRVLLPQRSKKGTLTDRPRLSVAGDDGHSQKPVWSSHLAGFHRSQARAIYFQRDRSMQIILLPGGETSNRKTVTRGRTIWQRMTDRKSRALKYRLCSSRAERGPTSFIQGCMQFIPGILKSLRA